MDVIVAYFLLQDCTLIPVLPFEIDQAVKGSVKGSVLNIAWPGNKSFSTIGGRSMHEDGFQHFTTVERQDFSNQYKSQNFGNQFTDGGATLDYRRITQGSAYYHTWLTNGLYLEQVRMLLDYSCVGFFVHNMSEVCLGVETSTKESREKHNDMCLGANSFYSLRLNNV